jgi:predicted Zn-dependent protease
MDRVAMLKEMLERNPKDAFARYGLAMEYSNSDQVDDALREFSLLLQEHPEYTAGYFMAAQALARVDRIAEARQMLVNGIACAERTGNQHARSEMQAMLQELEAA